jgi:hypothetical protein
MIGHGGKSELQLRSMGMVVAWHFTPPYLAARAKKYQGDAQAFLRYSIGSRI